MRALAALVPLALATACSVQPSDSRYVESPAPDPATFAPVAQLLDVRCGSTDCHGTAYRNLRLYGSAGLRLSSNDRPFVPACDTNDEVAEDYASVTGLEPEVMAAVVTDHGASPERLTMVRKARGTEAHKGLQVWSAGDDSDTCLVSWLSSQVATGACKNALAAALPGGATNPIALCVSP